MAVPSPKRHRRLLAAVALVVLAAVGAAVWLLTPGSLEQRVKHIRPGMTQAEVERVLGAPPGIHARHTAVVHRGGVPDPGESDWWWDDGHVTVWFDPAGRAERVYFQPYDPPTLVERWRRELE